MLFWITIPRFPSVPWVYSRFPLFEGGTDFQSSEVVACSDHQRGGIASLGCFPAVPYGSVNCSCVFWLALMTMLDRITGPVGACALSE